MAVIRTKKVGKLEGSFSAIARRIFAIHFLSLDNGLALVGAVVHLPDRDVCSFGVLWAIVADGDGIRQLMEAKGASAIKSCPFCCNVVSRVSLAAGDVVCLSCSDPEKFKLHSHDSLYSEIEMLFRLEADWMSGRVTKTVLNQTRQAIGFVPSVQGVWGDNQIVRVLRPTETVVCDWVHNLIQDGVWTREFNAYLRVSDEACEESYQEFVEL